MQQLFKCSWNYKLKIKFSTWSNFVDVFRANGEAMAGNTEVLDNGVIRFLNVDGSEQGSYVCTATNTGGTVTATATLRISGQSDCFLANVTVEYQVSRFCHC